MNHTKEFKSKLILLFSMSIFGTIGVFRRYIPFPSGMISLCRAVIGTCFLLGFLFLKGNKPDFPAIKRNLKLLIPAGIMLGFNWILLFEAYQYTQVSTATLCYYMEPVFFILAAAIILKEKLSLKSFLCVIAALIGMGLVSGFDLSSLGKSATESFASAGSTNLKGVLLGLAAAVLYTAVVLISKHLKNIDGVNVSLMQLAISSIVLIPYVLIVEDVSTVHFTSLNTSMLLIIGIVHTGIAYALYYSCLKDLNAQTVALYSYIDPVISVLLAVIILNEKMSFMKLLGATLILGAAIINEFYPHSPKAKE